ncbi:MAG: hypothetical protein K1X29_09080 [Bdellovibrionales bacterium]|nr:hypothetical protein [Bdellovibrionales bacterium]
MKKSFLLFLVGFFIVLSNLSSVGVAHEAKSDGNFCWSVEDRKLTLALQKAYKKCIYNYFSSDYQYNNLSYSIWADAALNAQVRRFTDADRGIDYCEKLYPSEQIQPPNIKRNICFAAMADFMNELYLVFPKKNQ